MNSCWLYNRDRLSFAAASGRWNVNYGPSLLFMTAGSRRLMAFGRFSLVDSDCSFGCLRHCYGRHFLIVSASGRLMIHDWISLSAP